MADERTHNLLGALALGLADRMQQAAGKATDLSVSACTVLMALGPYPGTPIFRLAQVLGLTHSVVVRLVDGLVRDGLLSRRPGTDRREVLLSLTQAGARQRELIAAAREDVLRGVFEALPLDEQRRFDAALSSMLTQLTTSRAAADHLCRLCDEFVCTPERCPVECEAVRLTHEAGHG